MGQQMDKPSRVATVAAEGNVKLVKRSVSSAGSIDMRNDDGRSALMLAVEHGHAVATQTLLEAGADVNTRELSHTSGRTVLMLAIEGNAMECVKALLRVGVDVNSLDSGGQTAIMYAVKMDNSECLQLLVKAGANLDHCDRHGVTPLILAVKTGHLKCLESLLQAGADPNVLDSTGSTCVLHAIKDICQDGLKFLQVLLLPRSKVKVNINLGDKNGMTALMHCIRNGNLECFRELLRAHANLDARDSLGRTVLMLAADPHPLKMSEEEQSECVSMLIDAGSKLNVRDYEGQTALMHAVQENLRASAANILRSRGADVNIPDKSGFTILLMAIRRMTDNGEFVKFLHELVENDVNLDVVDKWGKTALIHALELKDPFQEKAVALLQMGANPHTGQQFITRCSPLTTCAVQKHFEKGATERTAIAKYFIASCFLNNFDVAYRPSQNKLPGELDDSMKILLHKLYSSPWPLSRLALVAVSTAIGSNPGREKRVKLTHLPQRIQNLLLFQESISCLPRHHWDSIPLCFDPSQYESLPKARPLIMYWPFGRELVKCYCKKCQGRGLNFQGV